MEMIYILETFIWAKLLNLIVKEMNIIICDRKGGNTDKNVIYEFILLISG